MKNSSIGIIGGADGPTSILISGSKSLFLISSIFAGILIIVVIYLIIKKSNN